MGKLNNLKAMTLKKDDLRMIKGGKISDPNAPLDPNVEFLCTVVESDGTVISKTVHSVNECLELGGYIS
jgi:hypothetical protein